jgi:thiosulfate/3-mercaptopyruvate sulfurtransferase
MGHENVWVLDGGLPAWVKPISPIEKLVPIPLHLAISESISILYGQNTADVLANIKSKTAVIIDARSNDRFLGLTQSQELGCVADIFLVQLTFLY